MRNVYTPAEEVEASEAGQPKPLRINNPYVQQPGKSASGSKPSKHHPQVVYPTSLASRQLGGQTFLSVLLACPDRADVPLPSAISTAVWTRDSENRPGHGRKKRYSTDLMNRYLAPITVVLLSLAGCVSQSQVPKCDPFFGRTTIPPPPTGSAAGRCADPYYQTLPGAQTPPPPQSPGCPPASSAAPASPPGAASTWAVPRGGAANASPPPSNPSSSAIAPSQLAPRPPLTAPPPSRTAAPPAPYGNPPPAALGNPLPPSSPPAPSSAALLLPRHREARAPAMAIPRRLALWAIVEYRYRERGPRLRGLTSRRLCRQRQREWFVRRSRAEADGQHGRRPELGGAKADRPHPATARQRRCLGSPGGGDRRSAEGSLGVGVGCVKRTIHHGPRCVSRTLQQLPACKHGPMTAERNVCPTRYERSSRRHIDTVDEHRRRHERLAAGAMGCAGAQGCRPGAGVAEPCRPAASQAESFAAIPRRSGEPLARLLVEGYALVREAARRTINMRHFDVQILGGIAMFHRSIVEMQTGEGKTLAATLPMYLHGLLGRGCHLATVNDYLARRDADWMGPIYQLLGMTVGVVETQMSQPQRRKSYACDVTYGTAKEFGFDFLRDRLLLRRIAEGQTDLLGGMLGQGGRSAGRRKTRPGRPLFRPGRRGRQHPDRRGAHAADHQRPADRGGAAGGRMLQVERVGHRGVRRGRRLRLRPREEDGRTDPRGPPKSPHAAQARGDGHRRHGEHLPVHRAGDPGRPRVPSSTANTSSATARS